MSAAAASSAEDVVGTRDEEAGVGLRSSLRLLLLLLFLCLESAAATRAEPPGRGIQL